MHAATANACSQQPSPPPRHLGGFQLSRPSVILEHIFEQAQIEQLKGAIRTLRAVLAGLEPAELTGELAAQLTELFAQAENLGAASKALCAKRVAESGTWRASKLRSPAHWLAHKTGGSVGGALDALRMAEHLSGLGATDRAVRSGELSPAQAKEVAAAAAVAPEREDDLLRAAKESTLCGLKEQAARVRAAAQPDAEARYEAIRRRRRLRTWTDAEGAFRIDGLLTPDAGAAMLAVLEPIAERLRHERRDDVEPVAFEACLADALTETLGHAGSCDRAPARLGPRRKVFVHVDAAALARRTTQPGELCEIDGAGPIPPALAARLLEDSLVAILERRGVEVTRIAHAGRHIPAHLRSALEALYPKCSAPGCDERRGLEIDHVVELARGGQATLANLERPCAHHHDLKTHRRTRTPNKTQLRARRRRRKNDGGARAP